jgi:hypothetical protein
MLAVEFVEFSSYPHGGPPGVKLEKMVKLPMLV